MSPCRAELQLFSSLLAAGAAPIGGYAEQDFLNWRYQVGPYLEKHWGYSPKEGGKQEQLLRHACSLVLCMQPCPGCVAAAAARFQRTARHSAAPPAAVGSAVAAGMHCGTAKLRGCVDAWLHRIDAHPCAAVEPLRGLGLAP